MLKRIDVYKRTEEEGINHSLAEWAFDSHNWKEQMPGYFLCEWCGAQHTSSIGIDINFPLCKENPVIRKFLIKDLSKDLKA